MDQQNNEISENISAKFQYQAKISKYFLVAFVLHVIVYSVVAHYIGQSVKSAAIIAALILVGPLVNYMINPFSRLTPSLIAIAGMAYSAHLIHLGGGMIEMHFHVFVFLATLSIFGQIIPVLVGVLTIAAHHILFYFFLPKSLFNYEASFWIVLLHALFVIIEAIPVTFIAYKFGRVIEAQATSLEKIVSAGTKISSTSEHLSATSEKLSKASQQQASSLEETSASLTEISGMAEANVKGAEFTDDIAKEVFTITESTRKSMESLSQTMGAILESNSKIEKLVKVIEEIAEKTQVIDDIVFKTQLLSFNASVEAERAGEHGRGFAVVAQEVGNLAQLSGKAALEISTIVKNSIKEAESVSTENKSRVTTGGKLAQETKDKMEQVLQKMNEILENISKIVQASREQGQGINQISTSVESISGLTQETAGTAEDTAKLSSDLAQQSKLLMDLVAELKLT